MPGLSGGAMTEFLGLGGLDWDSGALKLGIFSVPWLGFLVIGGGRGGGGGGFTFFFFLLILKHKVSDNSGEGDREVSHVESCSVGSENTDLMCFGASRISFFGVIPESRKLIALCFQLC